MASLPVNQDRLMQLAVDQATEGLNWSEHEELEGLMMVMRSRAPEEIELAATATALALLGTHVEEPPRELMNRVRMDALRFRSEQEFVYAQPQQEQPVCRDSSPPMSQFRTQRWGWYAAAACLVLAVLGWWPRVHFPVSAPSDAGYAKFLQSTPDLIRASWKSDIEEYRSVTGEAVWSDARQTGYLVLAGLPSNPTGSQYQLWIVDPKRDRHAVDGGVFDVSEQDSSVIIPIHARLAVEQPTLFAITLEQLGGVVVSDGPLLVVAPVNG